MIQKKICMVGAFGVGKTSLVERFIKSIFSEKYFTSVGVRIEKKQLSVDGEDVTLMLWDLAGKDAVNQIKPEQLRGASGYILVADGTRGETLKVAIELQSLAEGATGGAPFTFVVNKSDLREKWEVVAADLEGIAARGWTLVESSAKTGDGVENLFLDLAARMLRKDKDHGGEQSAAASTR